MDWFSAPDYRLARLVIERGLGLDLPDRVPGGAEPVPRPARRARPAARAPRSSGGRASGEAPEPVPPPLLRPASPRSSRGSGPCCRAAMVAGPAAGGAALAPDARLARPLGAVSLDRQRRPALLRFGWESLLLEAGFLAIFLGNARTAPPLPVLLLFRWLAVPGGVRRGADQAPRRSVLARPHLPGLPPRDPADAEPAQLVLPSAAAGAPPGRGRSATTSPSSVAPFCLFLPQPIAGIGALLMIGTQAYLVLSGNYAWLNLLTMVSRSPPCRTHSSGACCRRRAASPSRQPPLWFVVAGRRASRRSSSCSATGRCATCSAGASS